MTVTKLTLAMGMALLALAHNANAAETVGGTDTDIADSVRHATGTNPVKVATTKPEIAWDATAGTVTARIGDASIEQVIHALDAEGVEVKAHDSWERVRISARFDDLPLHEATERLFGKSFILVGSKAASEGDPRRPFIRLLPVVEGYTPTSAGAEAIAAKTTPGDVARLESVVESVDREEAVSALESALVDGDERLRAAALVLIGEQNILSVDNAILRTIAHEDANPALRQQAVKVFANRVHEPDASWKALNYSAHNDANANVRESAKAALSALSMRAAYLYKRDLGRPPGAEKP